MAEHKPSIEHPYYRAFLFGHFMFLVAVFLVLSAFLPIEPPDQPPAPETFKPGISFDLTARYVLGVGSFLNTPAYQVPPSQRAAFTADFAESLETTALTAGEQMAVAVVLAELEDADRATAYLENLTREDWSDQAQEHYATLYQIYSTPTWLGDAEAGAALASAFGLYGTLAQTFPREGLPPELEAARETVRNKTRRTATALMVWMGVGLVLFFAAFPVAAVMGRRFIKGASRWGQASLNQKLPVHRTAFLEAMSAFMWFFIFFAVMSAFLPMMFQWLAFALPVGWLVLRGTDLDHIVFGVGLHRGRGIPREMLSGFIGYLAGIPILLLGFLLTLTLMNQTGSQADHPVVELFAQGGTFQKLNLLVMACVAAPIFEEIIFRGIFYHYLRGTAAAAGAALITGFFFAILHPQGWAAVPMLTAIGFVFAMIREWRGSLVASMTAHALNNLIPISLLLIFYGG
ncbi:CPBP family intramembrane glutamic endopeptidase [Acanthopleuribacter pedis]|uniref:CPBP family intramembrane metalloprotease n=1 Tax=Acanthopleuribacter pedis TaxID=442870 RepID=A0A8J7QDQ3_9BACT|nr:type II CAAX endopeptidase family protein [Acanthopleuribacter pedis]MBO1322662.1 CPBP family intramembrane metalloprotease [Acanthopleuribacter pedis]